MDLFNELLMRSGYWVLSNIHSIALALVATLLVIYGDNLNRFVKRHLRPYPRLLRILGFVLMCAFGYGALTVIFTPLLASWLAQIPVQWLAPGVLGFFLFIGWIAEKKQQV